MSLREQIYQKILKNDLHLEVRINGQIIKLQLPEIEKEYKVSYNIRKFEKRTEERAEELADQTMKLLLT